MADLKEKKFGFVVQNHNHCHPYPPFPGPIPPGINMQDWINYINSYIDVRARQMYEKLKGLVVNPSTPVDNPVKDYILLRDKTNSEVHVLFIKDGSVHSQLYGTYDDDGKITPDPDFNMYWDDETGRGIKKMLEQEHIYTIN